jgi:glyoxylase-like metal-dependent hydrolase (beta-lactamase superfamily II)
MTAIAALASSPVFAAEVYDYLPLPAQAKPLAEPKEGYRLVHVGTNGYVVISGVVQANFFVTKTGVVVVDAPPVLAEKLVKAIKSVTDKPVTHVILTHDHADHAGGVTAFPGAQIVAHALTAELLKMYPDPKRPMPTITFSGDRYDLEVGGTKFELLYPGPNHETGNIIVYLPDEKIAMMTDLFAPGWAPYLAWGNADHIPGLLKSYDALLALDFDVFLAGHAYRIGTRRDVEMSRAFFVDLWT